MEQICCKKNLGGKGNKVLQVLRKMIATRFEKKERDFQNRKSLFLKFGIEWLWSFWSFSKEVDELI